MVCPTCNANNPAGAPFCVECGSRLSAPPPPPLVAPTGTLPQQTILQGRYVVEQKLGQGGMGAVYRARDLRLSTAAWAVKEMSQAAITGPLERQQAHETFRREAELLAGLSHPGLPRVVDHFEQDGKAYLVMEFVPGESLLAVAQREGLPLPLPRVLDWARQICDVLEYLHGQDSPVIFRDLKPANVMLTPKGQIKLVDFGIARLFKPGKERDTQAFGTLGYSAPEQYGRGQTDPRSDVYSLGVLLHQLLTGYDPTTTPFRLPPAAQLNHTLPPQISQALARAVDPEPARRFASVRELRDALLAGPGQVLVAQTYAVAPDVAATPGWQAGGPPPISTPVGPADRIGSQPIGEPRGSTGLAQSSRWVGISSVAVMGISLLIAIVAAAQGDTSSGLAGFGYLLAFPAIAGAPVAFGLGIAALVSAATARTQHGRRHAIVGVATGAVTLVMCCAIFAIAGSGPSS